MIPNISLNMNSCFDPDQSFSEDLLAIGYNEVGNTSIQSKARIRIENVTNIKVEALLNKNTLSIQGAIAKLDEETLSNLVALVQIQELSELLKKITRKYPELGHPSLNVAINPETLKPLFVEIIFPYGDWKKWREVVKEVKGELREIGLGNLASKVAITCLQGLKE